MQYLINKFNTKRHEKYRTKKMYNDNLPKIFEEDQHSP
jgi:hypothetical protein